MAIVFAEEIAIIRDLSVKHQLGVATEHYGEKLRSEPALKGRELDAVAAANRFVVLRAALANQDRFMPGIRNIKHALSLRRDPYLSALREHLRIFHGGLRAGDRAAIREAAREIERARKSLARRARWTESLKWLSYLSVPVGIVEWLRGSAPTFGISFHVIGDAGKAALRRIGKKDEWVFFGT